MNINYEAIGQAYGVSPEVVELIAKATKGTLDDVRQAALRNLRMWHWREVEKARALERIHEKRADEALNEKGFSRYGYTVKKCLNTAARYKKLADHHIKAVQALNDVVPGTAENDCKKVKP